MSILRKNYKTKSGAGFTLIEVLVVIAIIGILASMIMVSLNTSRERARIAKAQTEISQIYMAIFLLEDDSAFWPGHKVAYKKQCGVSNNEICVYPADNCDYGLNDEESGITKDDLTNPPSSNYPNWRGPYYMPEVPIDPWGNEYFFDTDYHTDFNQDGSVECMVVIGSFGPNGLGNLKQDGAGGANDNDGDDILYYISSSD
jgi:prepilin-type N-terminal cleavage/methylation domain-containing protein